MFGRLRRVRPHHVIAVGVAGGLSLPSALSWSRSSPPPPVDFGRGEGGRKEGPRQKKRLVVIGSGVVGLSSAYCIERAAPGEHEIVVVDRHQDAGAGASYQNGGVINVEAIVPLSTYMSFPQTIKDALWSKLTGQPVNTTISLRALLEPGLASWLYYFWRNSGEQAVQRNAETMQQLGARTGPLFERASADLSLGPSSHNFARTPGLVLSRVDDPAAAVEAKRRRWDRVHEKQYVTGEHLSAVIASSGLCGKMEHNLGAIEPNNLTVNTRALCGTLRAWLEGRGVQFAVGEVRSLGTRDGRVTAVLLEDGGALEADTVVVAANFESVFLLRDVGVPLPLAPIKAYSVHIADDDLSAQLK